MSDDLKPASKIINIPSNKVFYNPKTDEYFYNTTYTIDDVGTYNPANISYSCLFDFERINHE